MIYTCYLHAVRLDLHSILPLALFLQKSREDMLCEERTSIYAQV